MPISKSSDPTRSTRVSSTEPGRPPKRLVVVEGVSGLAVLLRGLEAHVDDAIRELTAVVTVSDDGGRARAQNAR